MKASNFLRLTKNNLKNYSFQNNETKKIKYE